MSTDIKQAVDELAKKCTNAEKPDDAMKYAQAALNLAHAAVTLGQVKPTSD